MGKEGQNGVPERSKGGSGDKPAHRDHRVVKCDAQVRRGRGAMLWDDDRNVIVRTTAWIRVDFRHGLEGRLAATMRPPSGRNCRDGIGFAETVSRWESALMSRVVSLMACVLTFGLQAALVAAAEPNPLEGRWKLTSMRIQKQELSGQLGGDLILEVTGDRYVVSVAGEKKDSGKLKVDGSKKPGTIDLMSETPGAPEKFVGLFQLDGDRATFALRISGAERPASIDPESDDATLQISIYERAR